MSVDLAPALLASGDVLAQSWNPGSLSAIIEVLTDPTIWLGAAAGGAFGAALGALPAFVFTGFLVIAGVWGGDAAQGAGVDVGFGPVFGPHISFAGGAAAAAYAAKKGDMESGFDYHNAKDITVALGSRPDILAVGAAFGVFGIALEQSLRNGGIPTDPIAATVVISALAHRAAFGYSIIGTVSDKANGYMDMGPFEREEMREPGEVPSDGEKESEDRLAVEPWLPNMYKWSHVASIGLVAGLAGAYAAIQTGSPFLGFGISAASLLFLNLGVGKIPVTHHMTLPAATAYLATAGTGYSPIAALAIAGIFGVLGALVGEAFQRVFYAHGDTHVDPPAASIAINHTFIAILSILGILGSAVWVPGAV